MRIGKCTCVEMAVLTALKYMETELLFLNRAVKIKFGKRV